MPNITEQFKQAMRDAGLEPPDRIEPDKFMRFPSKGKGQSNNAAWCRLFPEGDGGSYGDWSQDIICTWFAKKHYTPVERANLNRQIKISQAQTDQERKARYASAASSALETWCSKTGQANQVTTFNPQDFDRDSYQILVRPITLQTVKVQPC